MDDAAASEFLRTHIRPRPPAAVPFCWGLFKCDVGKVLRLFDPLIPCHFHTHPTYEYHCASTTAVVSPRTSSRFPSPRMNFVIPAAHATSFPSSAVRGSTRAFTFLVGVRAVRVRPLHLRPAFMNGSKTITIKRSWEDLGLARQWALCEAIGPRLSAHNKYYSMLMRMAGILSYRSGPTPEFKISFCLPCLSFIPPAS